MSPLDALLLGFAVGFLSTVLMTLSEAPFYRLFGIGGVVEWEVNQLFVNYLLRRSYQSNRLKGALVSHMFHGTIVGGTLALVVVVFLPELIGQFWLVGLTVSVLLWIIVPFSIRRVVKEKTRVSFAERGVLISLVAHITYGLSLGLILQILLHP